MAKTANRELLDALIRHQVYLTRLAGSIRNQVLRLLEATEKDLEGAILARLGARRGFDTQSARRLRVLQRLISTIRGRAWDKIDDVWIGELTELARFEPTFTRNLVREISPVVVDMVLPPPEQLRAIVRERPMEGRVLREWASRQRGADLDRIMTAVQVGMVQGEDSRSIARRVVGTRQMHRLDGVTAITRREAEALTRTAVNFVSNASRRALFEANADLFDVEQFVATLDSRTTPVCRANDAKRFPVGQGPTPPLHFNCRSLRVAVLDGQVLSSRPAKPVTEQQLVREYTRRHGLALVSDRDRLPRGHKTAFDAFSRRRVREMVGTVPAKTSYQQWLRGQSAEFQDDVLGRTKGLLFRRGGLELDKFVNRRGDELTLSELASRERQAFIKAGLDPSDF